jgi:hypothetical protein
MNLIDSGTYTFEILRLTPQNDVAGQPLQVFLVSETLLLKAIPERKSSNIVGFLRQMTHLTRIIHELASRDLETGNPPAGLSGAQRARVKHPPA